MHVALEVVLSLSHATEPLMIHGRNGAWMFVSRLVVGYCVTMLGLLIGIVCAAIVVCVPVFEWLNFCAHLVRLRCELNSAKMCAGLPSGKLRDKLGKVRYLWYK